ncbi:ferritin-like domain-containing protein [Nakamurella leprariae]|uniref:DUF4439 domain-containing protein n=1 Tax=Nakamurella leprariae TaxID=2803911 RepID=A0A938YDQ8_9ACTN|nr:ferritin-like domain-containing protein [Nakamurella leprariae]MBM9465873.1 DUF4439 domain-containing protein [Nakamurella leprariae]
MSTPTDPTTQPTTDATQPTDGTGAATTTGPATSTDTAGPLAEAEITALQQALAAESAAVWGYELLAPWLAEDARPAAIALSRSHLQRREATAERLDAGGATPDLAAPAYQPATPVTDPATAGLFAQDLEIDCAGGWRAVIGSTDDTELRGFALAGLSDAAVRLAQRKLAAGVTPATVPFPGQA